MRGLAACSLSLGALLAACGPSKEERAKLAADSIVAIADSGGLVFRGTIAGAPVAIMVHDCKVYNLADTPNESGNRPTVIKPDFYPWPTACQRQRIVGDSAWVTVTVGRTGFGAGGCCATGGTYRTKDGRVWEREQPNGKWAAVAVDSAQRTADTTPADTAAADSIDSVPAAPR